MKVKEAIGYVGKKEKLEKWFIREEVHTALLVDPLKELKEAARLLDVFDTSNQFTGRIKGWC